MLYTAHHHHSPPGWDADAPLTLKGQRGYKKAHSNHPMTMWIRTHPGNYRWAASLGVALAVEHNKRFGTVHGCSKHIMWLSRNVPEGFGCHRNPNSTYAREGFPERVTPPPECMPKEYHHPNVVTAYHQYYRGSKLQFARWS